MTIKSDLAALAALAVLCSGPAWSADSNDEARVLEQLKKNLPGTHFTRVTRTPVPDLYQVVMGENTAYVSSRDVRYLFFGNLFDTWTLKDMSGQRQSEKTDTSVDGQRAKVAMETLPLGDAIKVVRGDGSRQLFVFSDPACPYCKRLEKELSGVKNVTVYTFVLPFFGRATPAAIWCSQDPGRAWQDFMQKGEQPAEAADGCATPLDRNLALAKKLGVRGTPAVFFADGSRADGAQSAEDLAAKLAAAQPARAVANAASSTKENM